jgi:hypothetical protein
MRLDDNIAFFKDFKGNLEENAQVLIAYHWRKKLKAIREKKVMENDDKEDVDHGKKGIQSKVKPYIDGKVGGGSFVRKGTFKQNTNILRSGTLKKAANNSSLNNNNIKPPQT